MSRMKCIVIVLWCILTTIVEVTLRELGCFFRPFVRHRRVFLLVLVLAWLVHRSTDPDINLLSLIDDLAIGLLASLLLD